MTNHADESIVFDPGTSRKQVEHWRSLDDLNKRVEQMRPRLPDLDDDVLLLIAVMARSLHHLTRKHGCMTYMRLAGDYASAKTAAHLMRRHPQNRPDGNRWFRWLSQYSWWLIFDQVGSGYRMREGGWVQVGVLDYLDGLFCGRPHHAPLNPDLPPPGPLPPPVRS